MNTKYFLYIINGKKIYKKLSIKQTQKYNELFSIGARYIRVKELKIYKQLIDKHYLSRIREVKHILKNAEKRFDYNMKRSDKLKGN